MGACCCRRAGSSPTILTLPSPQVTYTTGAPSATMGGLKVVKTKEEFDTIVNSSDNSSILIVVDFYATWCGPCKVIAPKLEVWSKEYEGKVLFIKVDVDENEETAESSGVSAMPTFQFFKKGEKVDEVIGANEAAIRSKIDSLV